MDNDNIPETITQREGALNYIVIPPVLEWHAARSYKKTPYMECLVLCEL